MYIRVCEGINRAGIAVVLRALSIYQIPMYPSELGRNLFDNRYLDAHVAGLYVNDYYVERGEATGSKTMFSLSSVILFRKRGVDSCIFLIFTTRVDLKTRLNGVKSIRFEQCRKF